ncbi:hypothetical protein H4R24_002411 [Coemansia sp. RSA 988]|nr:hypothetical protein H4R24_002411 [Coemansia sp. RSA 988]
MQNVLMAPVEAIVAATAIASLAAVSVSTESDNGLNSWLSDAIGYVSLVCWVVVMFPQIYLNYQRKSGEGVSLAMMVAWVIGDILNIAGALMQSMVMSTILIGTYYLFVDTTLLAQTIYYRLAYNAHRCISKDFSSSSPGNPTSNSHNARGDVDGRVTSQALLLDSSNDQQILRQSSDYASIASATTSDENLPCDHQGLVSDALPTDTRVSSRQQTSQLATVLAVLFSLLAIVMLATMLIALLVVPSLESDDDKEQLPSLPDTPPAVPNPAPNPSPGLAPLPELVAQIMGTASAVMYIMAYVPQALKNYRRKSCEGLSMWMFLLSLVGNTTYALAIMVVSLQPHYLAPYVPWILGSLIPCLIQAIVLYQFYVYAQ